MRSSSLQNIWIFIVFILTWTAPSRRCIWVKSDLGGLQDLFLKYTENKIYIYIWKYLQLSLQILEVRRRYNSVYASLLLNYICMYICSIIYWHESKCLRMSLVIVLFFWRSLYISIQNLSPWMLLRTVVSMPALGFHAFSIPPNE